MFALTAMLLSFASPSFAQSKVAKVGNTEYATIDEAVAAWTNGTTLTLLDDVTLSDVVTLSSQEHHYLALGTYTMTACNGKNAIEIKSYGRSNRSESGALTITADATNPGGINAGSKACIYYKYDATLASDQYDRPIIYINGGKFTGSAYSGISSQGHSSAQDKCATFNISGGIFDCGVNLAKTKLITSGGTFNGSLSCTGGSTSTRLISGGTFKNLGFMTADSNNTKFWIGTSMGNSNVGVHIDDNGYLVVGGPVVTAPGEKFEASSPNHDDAGFGNYLTYSSAATEGLYYTSVEEALADNNNTSGSVTVYVDELDMTGISYKGTIVVPAESKITITNAPSTLVVKDEEGNVLEAKANGTYTTVEPKGNDFTGYTRGDAIWGEVWGNATESFVIKVLDANGNEMGTTSLNNIGGIIDGDVNVTWSLKLDAASNTDEYWTMAWTTAPTIDNMPAKVELWVDGVKVSGGDVVLNAPDSLNKIYAAVTDASGKILSFHTDVQEAIKAAAAVTSVAKTAVAGTVELLDNVTVDKWIMFAENLSIGDGSLIILNINGVTIDGNGKTLTVKSIESAGNGNYLFYDAQNLTVKDLTINIADGLVGGIALQSGTISNVTFNGGKYGVFPGSNGVTIDGCTFNDTKSYAVYYEDARENIVVSNNTFNTADGAYAITMRSNEQFTDNTITKGRVNLANSAASTVSGNDFGDERFKVYNGATATISNNEINNLVFNETNAPAASTFTADNTLSAAAQAALDAVKFAVAKIGDVEYDTLAEAVAAAQAGDEIVLLGDVTEDVTLPAGVKFNGNGKTVGNLIAGGEITFTGVTKATSFGVQYTNTTVNIVSGASLQITGSGRMVIGHGCTFNITGTITDAKTADKATLVPSLKIAAGASITGNGVTFNVTNAYIVANANTTSKNSNANGTLDFNINNSIWEQTGVLAFYVPTSGMDPVVNFDLKNSVLTTTSHLVFAVTKGEIVFDNSNVNVGTSRQIENRSTMTIKNGSVVNGAVATSSNAINPGTIIVENATYSVTGEFSGAAEGTGTLVIKEGANVSAGSITKANIQIDATGMAAGDVVNLTANLSNLEGSLTVVNNNLDASIVDGKIVLAAKPVAKIGETKYATLAEAVAAALPGDVVEVFAGTYPVPAMKAGITVEGAVNADGTPAVLLEGTLKGTLENLTLKNLHIKGGNAQRYAYANGNLVFENVTFEATSVYALHFDGINEGTNLLYKDCTIIGWAAMGGSPASCVFDGCTIKDNGTYGVIRTYFDTTIKDCTFDVANANTGDVYQDGIHAVDGAEIVVDDCTNANGDMKDLVNVSDASVVTVDGVEFKNVAKIGDSYYATLAEAVAAAQAGETVTLLADVALTETLTVPAGKELTIDLNGKTISQTKEQTAGYQMILNDGNLTINDSSEAKTGKISYTDSGNGGEYISDVIYNRGVLVINGGTIENLSSATVASNGYPHAVDTYSGIRDTYVEINGGTIYCAEYSAIRMFCVSATNKADLVINGGTIKGAIDMQNGTKNLALGTLTINDGTFETTKNANNIRFANWNGGATEYGISAEIKGGSFNGGITTAYVPAAANWDKGVITGGTFAKDMTEYCAEGFICQANGDGTFSVADDPTTHYIADVDGLKAFRDDVNAGNTYEGITVHLTANIDLAGENWTPIGNITYKSQYKPADASKVFSGVFNGNGKVISNLKVERTVGGADTQANVGLFGITGEGAVIKDLTLTNVNIKTDGRNVGAIAGFAYKATLKNITVNGNIQIEGGNNVAGIAGMTRYYDMSATDITVSGDNGSAIVGNNIVGGIFAEIAPNGSEQKFDGLNVENVAVTGASGVGGIVGLLTTGAVENVSVKNVVLTGRTDYQGNAMGRIRLGSVAGLMGSNYATIANETVENVTAKNLDGNAVELPVIGANYDAASNATEAKIGNKYYATFATAYTAAQAGETVTLLADIEATEVILLDKSVTINGNGHKVTSNATRVFRVTTAYTEVTLNDVNMVSTAVRVGTNDVRGISIDIVDNVKLTLNNCSVDFTDASANDWAYAVNVTGGNNHVVTVNGGAYEGANVINVNGANNNVTVKNAVITCTYPNNPLYYGACIWVKQEQGSSVEATGNTFNGSNAIAFNLGTGTVLTESNNTDNTEYVVAMIGDAYYTSIQAAVEAAENGATITVIKDFAIDEMVTVVAGKELTIDLNGKTITGTDNTSKNFSIIDNRGNLTIKDSSAEKSGKITLTATIDSDWGRYSAVIANNPGGKLTIDGGTLEHLGGTDMAYGIDNLTNGKGTYAETVINGGTIKSTYRGIRQFLNGIEAQNILTINGGTVEGANKSVWMQDPSANANTGTLTIAEGAKLVGDAYLSVTAGSTEWPVEVSIAAAALQGESKVVTSNVPAGYELAKINNTYSVALASDLSASINGIGYITLAEAITAAQPGDVIKFLKDINESVTINKNVTIDGADKQYTGTMTGNAGLTVTVQNVNFVNGGFVKSAKSTTGTYTIKDCTFDGAGTYAYPLSFNGANTINVENCTVKDYLYSFLYVRSSTANVNVKDVTVENCPNYAVYFASGVTTATFEKLTVKNSNNGFVINNTANRAFTIKDCTMENVSTVINHSNGTNTITCTALGVNDFGTDEISEYAVIKGATITDTTYYGSVKGMVETAVTGQTVKLLSDIELDATGYEMASCDGYPSFVHVEGKAITVDLNGKTIKANVDTDDVSNFVIGVFSTDNGGELTLVDNSTEGTGTVKLEAAQGKAYSLLCNYEDGCKMTINGGTYKATKVIDCLVYSGGTTDALVTVNDGNFTLDNLGQDPNPSNAANGKPWIFNVYGAGDHYVLVNGGTFNADINRQHWSNEVYVAKECYTVANTDGTYTVNEGAVAYVNEGMLTGPYPVRKDVGYATLGEAFAAADDGDTVTLLKDIKYDMETVSVNGEYVDGLVYTGDKSFTVDFAGHTVTENGEINDYLIYLKNTGEKDNEITFKNGTITINSESTATAWAAITVGSGSSTHKTTLNLDSMEVINGNPNAANNQVIRSRNGAIVNLNKGTTVTSNGTSYGVVAETTATVNINDGAKVVHTNSGTTGGNLVYTAVSGNGVINIYDGAVIESDNYGIHNMTSGNAVINIYGGTITAPVAVHAATNGGADETATVNITGGTINGVMEVANSASSIIVSGGVFDRPVKEEFCAEGYAPCDNADGTYGVYYAVIDEVNFVDGQFTAHDQSRNMTVGKLTYERNGIPTTWTTFYVPFEVPVSQLADLGIEVAYINGVRRSDYNEDGKFDDGGFSMELIMIHGGKGNADGTDKTLKANYPYFIRSKGSEPTDLYIELYDALLYAAKNATYDCSTFTEKFEITGTAATTEVNSSDNADRYLISRGQWSRRRTAYNLAPFRFYMTVTSRDDNGPIKDAPASMSIVVRGEELPDGTTLIYDINAETGDNVIYDLNGRRVLETEKGNIYIINGKKVLVK